MMSLTAPTATITIAPATQVPVVADHTGALRAFQDGTLLIALEQGYGTLTRTKDGPHGNGDVDARFRYRACRLFAKVAAAAPPINQDPDTIIIENDYGQIGEDYGNDFMPGPSDAYGATGSDEEDEEDMDDLGEDEDEEDEEDDEGEGSEEADGPDNGLKQE